MLLGLAIGDYFGTWEVTLVGVSLGTMCGLMIGTVEESIFGLSLVLPLVSPLESPNPGADLPGTLLGAPHGLCFGFEVVRCRCSCRRFTDLREDTCGGVGVS